MFKNLSEKEKQLCAVAAIIFGLILIISIIGVIFGRQNFKIGDFDTIESRLSNNNLTKLEDYLWENVKEMGAGSGAVGLIRPSTYKETEFEGGIQYEFLVDVDAVPATISVKFTILNGESLYEAPTVGCVSIKTSKYKEADACSGVATSSLEATFGTVLPQEFELTTGERVVVTTEYSEEKKNHLVVYIGACGDAKKLDEGMNLVTEWLNVFGYTTEEFPLTSKNFCDVSKNNQDRGFYAG